MKKYANETLKRYTELLSLREPVPGGGSAAALSGALGAALLSMVTNYSISKKKTPKENARFFKILKETEKLRKRFLELVDLDAKAYLKIVNSRNKSEAVKNFALKEAAKVPQEVCSLSCEAVFLSPELVRYGNQYLLSDVEAAVELLHAAFNSALVMLKVNK
ncbi:MAG: cyclodeaminase/cyclohydrolase family protein [Candidatus Omnitrophica bacterium]|nr:cyclodeaminase/cyclohydrolase family protein [Candidatus Omnitrophota bacterium]